MPLLWWTILRSNNNYHDKADRVKQFLYTHETNILDSEIQELFSVGYNIKFDRDDCYKNNDTQQYIIPLTIELNVETGVTIIDYIDQLNPHGIDTKIAHDEKSTVSNDHINIGFDLFKRICNDYTARYHLFAQMYDPHNNYKTTAPRFFHD